MAVFEPRPLGRTGRIVGPLGLAASFAKPGGNVTGVADFASPSGKHLEILKQVLPDTKRVAVLHNPTAAQTASQMRETREFARALGLELFAVEVRVAAEIDSAVAAINLKSGSWWSSSGVGTQLITASMSAISE